MNKLHAISLGYAGAIVSAVLMLVLGVFGNLGIFTSAVEAMKSWHIFFSLSPMGIIGGMIEAAVFSFVLLYLFSLTYNWLLRREK